MVVLHLMSFRKNLLLVAIPSFKLPPLQYSVTRNRFVLLTFFRASMIQPYLCLGSSVRILKWVSTYMSKWFTSLSNTFEYPRTPLQDNPISLSNLSTHSKASNPNTHSMTWHLDMSPTVRMLSRKICCCCSCSCWGKDLSTVPLLKCHHLDFF